MKKGNILLLISASLAIASVGYWFYEKKRKQAIDERVDSYEEALKRLEEAKK